MTPTDIFNAPEINARTDAARAAEPTDLPEVGTMILLGDYLAIITCADSYRAYAIDMSGSCLETLFSDEGDHWTYAAPEQREQAWGGE